MRYICIQCGAGGASAADDKHPPTSYHCIQCGVTEAGENSMWPEPQANLFRSTFAAYNRANTRAHSRPLTLYLADGAEHKVPYSDELMAFTFGEMNVRNPLLSECGRFAADPKDYGFEGWASGGGCVGLRKNLEGGRYMLLTDSDGLDLPDSTGEDLLGLYSKDGEPIAIITIKNIPFSE